MQIHVSCKMYRGVFFLKCKDLDWNECRGKESFNTADFLKYFLWNITIIRIIALMRPSYFAHTPKAAISDWKVILLKYRPLIKSILEEGIIENI